MTAGKGLPHQDKSARAVQRAQEKRLRHLLRTRKVQVVGAQHRHAEYVEGCFRCDLTKDELVEEKEEPDESDPAYD